MSTPKSSQEPVPSEVDRGLRSVQGIRWLLLAGGLVVAVSVIRLVAAEWGILSPAARFLTLVVGALAVFAAGDVTRRRLCLPVAGSALLFLGTALVPLLAWGAAYLRLLDAPFGWPSLMLGLGALLAAADRTLRGVLAYRGGTYTVASSIFMVALPVLPYLEARYLETSWSGGPEVFFLVAAGALGLLLRGASRHVNRFFFHRDRLSGIERPVHGLPFALLILLYGAGMSLLAAFSTHLAVPLVFVALALIDAGEEYHRALIRATGGERLVEPKVGSPEGEQTRRWPRRSLALLALGFSAMATSLAASVFDAGRHSLALVASIAALRLLAWAWRSSSTAAYTWGLLVGIVAYHAFPVLIPDVLRNLFQLAVGALGVDPRGAGALSLGDLGMVAALLGLGWVSKGRLTPAMRRVHAWITAASTSLVLLISLTEPVAARLVAPAAAALLAAGLITLRFKALIPALYQALATTALAWAWDPAFPGTLLSARSALLLGAVHLLFLGAGLQVLRRREAPPGDVEVRLLTWPPLAVAFALLLKALDLGEGHWGVAGILTLVAAETFLLSALVLGRAWLFAAATLGLVAGTHSLAASWSGEATAALSIVSQGLMVVFWLLAYGLERRGESLAGPLRQAARLGFFACATSGLVWLAVALDSGPDTGIEAFHLALLAGLLIAGELLAAARESAGEQGTLRVNLVRWRLETGLTLSFLWVPIQAADSVAGNWLTLVSAGWLALAVAMRAGAELLKRRGRRDLASPFLAVAWVNGAVAGAAAIWTTLDTSGSPWLSILPGFLASLFFVFMAFHRHYRKSAALLAMGYFAACSAALLLRLETWGPELYCLGPGLALLGLSGLLRHELDERWRQRLFTAGATLLYAMPVLGLLEELSWGWQIVLLLFAVAFGAASFRLRSRSLLILSTAALVVDLACFLIKLRQTAPLLVWVAGIVFGLGLMAVAALLEHRREVLLQHIRIWGRELRSWA